MNNQQPSTKNWMINHFSGHLADLFGIEVDQLAGFANENPVAIVESEKTAVIMSALRPDYTWLATGGLSNLNPVIFSAMKRYKIQLFPDLGDFPTWQKKSDELKKVGFEVSISDLLKRYAQPNEISAGFDLADYFI